jgi:hypothetical protein
MSKTKNNVNALLAAIKRQTPEPAPPQTETEEPATYVTLAAEKPKRKEDRPETTTAAKKTKPKSRVGKAVQFWMHEEDTQLVRELSAWLAGQGVRPSDSMVIRTALRYAKTGNALLEAYRQASRLDGRLKQD